MHIKACTAIILCLSATTVWAEYRDPNAMSQEEYQQARQIAGEHEQCMNEFAMSRMQPNSDPRVIADHSMKHCAPILENLHEKIVSWDYPPEFGKYYVSGISNRNASKLLGNLMRYMAMPR
ncbi:MAG: hypothetical protein RIB78_07040 [Gammaproteobacteria bacterium]